MNNIYPGMGDLSLCDLMKLKVFGQPLWQYGFWDLMYRVLSNEGYQFMRDAGGYDANVANANAVTQLPATEYGDTTQFLTLRDGYDQLPITLAHRFNQLPGGLPKGGRVRMNHRLAAIEIAKGKSEYPYTLIFKPTTTTDRRTRLKAGGADIKVRAKKVILAMPRRSLELVESEFFEDPWLKANIPSVLIQSAFKLFLAYESPWWRALGLVAGRSVTDLPIRQTYYFGTEAEQDGGLPFMNSLLMASYNDISTVPFWKGLENGAPYEGYRPSCLEPGVTDVMPTMEFPATAQMVQIANRQVAEVHALPELPMPYSAVYHTWNEDPYGGGWHEWKANYRLDEIMCRMRKPVPDARHSHRRRGLLVRPGVGGRRAGYGRIHAAGLLRLEAAALAEEELRAAAESLSGLRQSRGLHRVQGPRLRQGARGGDAELSRQGGDQLMTVADYLIARLKQAGLAHLFAVPGDYASPFLVALDATPGIARIANINELGSGYAADGYARFRGIGAACVQYGVGTFSLLNCTAGSFVERLPVVVISASPSTTDRQLEHSEQILFHHSTGDLRADQIVFQNVTVASEILKTGAAAPAQIDRAIVAMLTHRRPIYLEGLNDVWNMDCAAPKGTLAPAPASSDPQSLAAALDAAWARIQAATLPVLWAGVEVRRFGLQDTLQQIVDASGLPFTTTSLGKTILDESQPQFVGTYAGPGVSGAHARRHERDGLPDRARHDHHRRLPRHHDRRASGR